MERGWYRPIFSCKKNQVERLKSSANLFPILFLIWKYTSRRKITFSIGYFSRLMYVYQSFFFFLIRAFPTFEEINAIFISLFSPSLYYNFERTQLQRMKHWIYFTCLEVVGKWKLHRVLFRDVVFSPSTRKLIFDRLLDALSKRITKNNVYFRVLNDMFPRNWKWPCHPHETPIINKW